MLLGAGSDPVAPEQRVSRRGKQPLRWYFDSNRDLTEANSQDELTADLADGVAKNSHTTSRLE